jgi:hypothetical protein
MMDTGTVSIKETLAMTTLPPPTDALAESRHLIAALERLREEIPFADDVLALHRPTHHELEASYSKSERAVAAWRAALAQRWEREVAGRRLYKRIIRQYAEHYGSFDAPQVQALTRGEAEANSSPAELLTDLRRVQAALSIAAGTLAFAPERLAELEVACAELEAAITSANICETERRTAVLDSRMAGEAYRRARHETRRLLADHYGEGLTSRFGDLLE